MAAEAGSRRAPALALAAALLAGSALEPAGTPLAGLGAATVLLGLALFLLKRGGSIPASLSVLAAFFLLGGVAHRLAREHVERQPLARLYDAFGERGFDRPARLEGSLRQDPELRPEAAVLVVDVERVRLGRQSWRRTGGLRALVRGDPSLRDGLADLAAGDRIRFWADLGRPRSFGNPGARNGEESAASRSITLSGSVKSALLVERIDGGAARPRWDSSARRFIRRRIERILPGEERSETAGILLALLIGDRSRVPRETAELHQKAGTFHVMAISGLHVGLLGWMLYASLRFLCLGQRAALRVVLLILPAYAYLCGGRPSVVRAVIMAGALIATKLLGLDGPYLNGIGLAALALLSLRPLDLGDPGFQLSFAATTSILAFGGTLDRVLRPRLGRIGSLLAVSLAAQAGVVPVTAEHFQRLTPGALPANLVVLPAAAALLVVGIASIVLPVPALGALAEILVRGLELGSRLALALPAGTLRVPAPTALWTVAYLLALLAGSFFHGRARRAAVVAILGLVVRLAFPPSPADLPELRLTALDVGHGDALLVEIHGGGRLLVDGGGSYVSTRDIGETVVVPFLLNRGIRRLDAVVATHAHFDHTGGLSAVLETLRVGELWLGAAGGHRSGYDPLWRAARRQGVPVRRLYGGEAIELGRGRIRVLSAGRSGEWPDRDANNDSIVLHVTYGSASLLLTGDAEKELETELLESGFPLEADVLKVAHHGSKSSSLPQFLDAVSPRLAVLSTRASPYFGIPSRRVLHRLRERGIPLLRTDRDGAITVRLDGRGAIGVESVRRSAYGSLFFASFQSDSISSSVESASER